MPAPAKFNPADLAKVFPPEMLAQYPELQSPVLADILAQYVPKRGQQILAKALPRLTHHFSGRVEPAALQDALDVCRNARALIKPEQAKLEALLRTEIKEIKREYIKYQIELVALQMNRAAEAAERRVAYIRTVGDWDAEREKCRTDILHWFHQWAWTLDPRKDSPLATIPFIPFEFQENTIHWLDSLVNVERSDGVVEKSRDQGWTWISTAWSTYHWSYDDHFQALFGSKNEDAVDSMEEPDTILEKARFQLRLTPTQLLPDGFDLKKHMGYMKITNPENGSVISGEAPIPNFGRSGRYTVIFFDEHAAWPHSGRPQWTAASASSKSKISASTPQGTLTKQAELAKGDLPKLTLKWPLHPWKDQRWYNGQTLSMDEQEIAQEIDIDYEASQPGPIYAKLWDKQYHVITWSEFARVFRVRHKPQLWNCSIYQDVGTSIDHPTATGWYTRPAVQDGQFRLIIDDVEYAYDLSDTAFLYRTMTIYDEEIGNIWDKMCLLMRPAHERERLRTFRMSHEAESERKTLRKNKVTPAPVHWTPGRNRGIAEFKNALKLKDLDKPNPFKPHLQGRPEFMIIVADGQYDNPVDDFGMARFQEEIAAYHMPKQVLGEPVKAQTPYAFFNDHMDQSRMAAADGFVSTVELTADQRREQSIPEEYRLVNLLKKSETSLTGRLTMSATDQLAYELQRQFAAQRAKPRRTRYLADDY
jgi:hypothetical protein